MRRGGIEQNVIQAWVLAMAVALTAACDTRYVLDPLPGDAASVSDTTVADSPSDAHSPDGQSHDGADLHDGLADATSCACQGNGRRCAGQMVQLCQDGIWRDQKTCDGTTTYCVSGGCAERVTVCNDLLLAYDGSRDVINARDPEMIGSLLQPHSEDTTVSYVDAPTLELTRDLARDLPTQVALCIGFKYGVNFNSELLGLFGLESTQAAIASSADGVLGATKAVLEEGKVGAWYRQVLEIRRVATISDGSQVFGEITLVDYMFRVEFAVADQGIPSSSLPTGPVDLPPCFTAADGCSCSP